MKRNLFKFSFVVFGLLAMVGCSEDEVETTGSIIGKITDVNGEVLSGVTINVTPSGLSRTTGNDGTYEIVELAPAQYTLLASKDGYNSNSKTVTVISGQAISGDMVLTKKVSTADINVTPSTLNFGTTQEQLSVMVTNNGDGDAVWSLDLGENHWLSATPMSGSIKAGKSQSIVFSVDRNKVSDSKSAVVILSADGNSLPITISCSGANAAKAEMHVSPTTLDFGGTQTIQDIRISNTGEAALAWQIKGITESAISVSEMSGTVASGGSKVVRVTLDRDKMTSDINTSLIVSDGEKDVPVYIAAKKNASSDDNDEPDNGGSFSGTVTSVRPGLAVKLTGVSLSNNILTVDFTVQNNESFDIYEFAPRHGWNGGGEFIAYDDKGNTYSASDVQELTVGSQTDSGYLFDVRVPIPMGVKMSCRLKIKGVASGVTGFQNISLPCLYYNQAGNITYDQKKIVFSNLTW